MINGNDHYVCILGVETSAIDDDFSVQQSKDIQTNSSSVIESSTEGEPLQNYFFRIIIN